MDLKIKTILTKARTNLSIEQRVQPGALLLVRTISQQHLHVARIRRTTIEHLGLDQLEFSAKKQSLAF
jgi:hypothetical protein